MGQAAAEQPAGSGDGCFRWTITAAKQAPMTEIDHGNRPSAADSQSNRNPRCDKHLQARDFHYPRQCLLGGQGSTVTFGTEIKGTPASAAVSLAASLGM